MKGSVFSSPRALAEFDLSSARPMPFPSGALMCPPSEFDGGDLKNPYMEGQIGNVDRALARRQWEGVRRAFLRAGAAVETIAPSPGCEDMVFAANPACPGLGPGGEKICALARMKHPSRRREVPAFADWFRDRGYRVAQIGRPEWLFEGCGDAIWHPGRGVLWEAGATAATSAFTPNWPSFSASRSSPWNCAQAASTTWTPAFARWTSKASWSIPPP